MWKKTHWALNTLLGFNTNTWNLNEMIVIFKKTTTLSSWACRKISVLLFLDRAPMGSGEKGGSGGCLSCGFVNIYFVINMSLWTDLLIFRRQARERHLARLTHGTTFGSCHSSPRTLLFLNALLSLPGEIITAPKCKLEFRMITLDNNISTHFSSVSIIHLSSIFLTGKKGLSSLFFSYLSVRSIASLINL